MGNCCPPYCDAASRAQKEALPLPPPRAVPPLSPPLPAPPPPQSLNPGSNGGSGRGASGRPGVGIQLSQLTVFKYRDLELATNKFKEDLVLGVGGFGTVYKGWIKDGVGGQLIPVAVKKLKPDSKQGEREWLQEILHLSRLRHPNLVRLIGYCAEHSQGLLVYEFMPNGSLDYHLFMDAGMVDKPLSLEIRVKIALGAAEALAYLHQREVVHRDFKPANILLDRHYNVKLTDFGYAKATDANTSGISTRILGDRGYLDPRYLETGLLNKKSDVYSFGILLLELLTGQPAVDVNNEKKRLLVEWAEPLLVNPKFITEKLFDPALQGQVSSKVAERAAIKLGVLARHCIQKDPKMRPLMSDVVISIQALLHLLG